MKEWIKKHKVDLALITATIGLMTGVAMISVGSYKLGCAMTIAEIYETLN